MLATRMGEGLSGAIFLLGCCCISSTNWNQFNVVGISQGSATLLSLSNDSVLTF